MKATLFHRDLPDPNGSSVGLAVCVSENGLIEISDDSCGFALQLTPSVAAKLCAGLHRACEESVDLIQAGLRGEDRS